MLLVLAITDNAKYLPFSIVVASTEKEKPTKIPRRKSGKVTADRDSNILRSFLDNEQHFRGLFPLLPSEKAAETES